MHNSIKVAVKMTMMPLEWTIVDASHFLIHYVEERHGALILPVWGSRGSFHAAK